MSKSCTFQKLPFPIRPISSPKPKAHKVNLYERTRAGVIVCALTISNMKIFKTRGRSQPNLIRSTLGVGGKPVLCFEPNRIRTPISMAADTCTSNRVIMGKMVSPRLLGCF